MVGLFRVEVFVFGTLRRVFGPAAESLLLQKEVTKKSLNTSPFEE